MYDFPLITVCVCTYHRQALLADLLSSLASQRQEGFQFDIVVVDNDCMASAESTVETFKKNYPHVKIWYEVEPIQGISYARNRAVQLALGQYFAFIDDDERASENWLSDLLLTITTCDSDAVFGPVLPIFPKHTKSWILKSQFFERPRFKTGHIISSNDARTGNALIKATWCRQRIPNCFLLELAQSGGEDHDFFNWVELNGGRFVWCDTATVEEIVPLERQVVRYMLVRRLRASSTYWQKQNDKRSIYLTTFDAVKGGAGGALLFIAGILILPSGLANAVRIWGKSMNGFGRLTAIFNVKFIEYKKKEPNIQPPV